MKIEVTDVSPIKKTLEVEADPEEVSRETEAVVRRFAQKVRIPGFRAGKVPLDIVRRRFAREIEDDVRERLVSRLYTAATRDTGLRPLGDPVLDELTHETGRPFRFKTTFEVLPEFQVKSYEGVEVREPPVTVSVAEVDEALDSLRRAHATYLSEEGRAAQTGDLVVADVEEAADGGESIRREGAVIEVGSTDLLPSFNEAIHGATPGARLEFVVHYPEGHSVERLAGKDVRYVLDVKEVKRQQIPELDDEFARDLGDFESLVALRERVQKDLEERKASEARRGVRQAILDKVLLENPIPLPEVLVDEEIQHRLEDVVRAMMMHGVDPRRAELDWKELRERQVEPARKTVHARLVLDAIGELRSIRVERAEVEGRIRAEAERIGESVEGLRGRLVKTGGLEALQIQMVREKSLDFLTSIANIQKAE